MTISGGVPAGAASAVKVPEATSATPLSRAVGTPGRKSTRSPEVTAMLLGLGTAARRKQDDEFVASVPDARIVRPGRLLQDPGDLLQRTIAGEVPVIVVDDLEVVEIQQNERELRGRPAGAAQLSRDLKLQRARVAEPGQAIFECLLLGALEHERIVYD